MPPTQKHIERGREFESSPSYILVATRGEYASQLASSPFFFFATLLTPVQLLHLFFSRLCAGVFFFFWRLLPIHSATAPPTLLLFLPFVAYLVLSAYAKLGMISSALSSDSDDVTKLLNVSLDLITSSAASANATADKRKTSGKQTGPTTKQPLNPKSIKGLDGGGIADSERAVEVLSFLVSKTKVRCRF